MPRLTPAAIYHASKISRHLPLLLRECRDLDSAKNELRWLIEFVAEKRCPSSPLPAAPSFTGASSAEAQKRRHNGTLLDHLVTRRAKGEPLQYILGTQPFGDLEILCRPHVLIPRPETEVYTAEVARILRELDCVNRGRVFSIADFCCGTGCISLLLHSLLRSPFRSDSTTGPLRVRGFDVSAYALNLAQENLDHNLELRRAHASAADEVRFEELDILELSKQPKHVVLDRLRIKGDEHSAEPPFDIIISNPPYISLEDFAVGGRTTKSVRQYEPELALVPPSILVFDEVNRADQFYAALLRVTVATKPKLLVMEVGDVEQAIRVRDLCKQYLHTGCELDNRSYHSPFIEIWRDDSTVLDEKQESPHEASHFTKADHATNASQNTNVDVDCRAVVLWLDPNWIQFRHEQMNRL